MSRAAAGTATITIPARFNGPPGTANGGYTCGRIVALAGPGMEIRLLAPPPLDTPLTWAPAPEGGGTVSGPAGPVAVATPASSPWPAPPEAPPPEVVAAAEADYTGYRAHAFPTCFVCGTERADGLGLRPGPIAAGTLACRWLPAAEFTEAGWVRPEIVAAALDCPSGWATGTREARPVVLGSMRTRQEPVPAGTELTITAQTLGGEGRRYRAVSALWHEGELLGIADSVWIALRSQPPEASPGA